MCCSTRQVSLSLWSSQAAVCKQYSPHPSQLMTGLSWNTIAASWHALAEKRTARTKKWIQEVHQKQKYKKWSKFYMATSCQQEILIMKHSPKSTAFSHKSHYLASSVSWFTTVRNQKAVPPKKAVVVFGLWFVCMQHCFIPLIHHSLFTPNVNISY